LKRPLYLRDAALIDLQEAFDYEERRPGLGPEFIQAVHARFEQIEVNPEHHPFAVDDVRQAPLRRFPYVVYYVVLADTISVIAVMHSRRHPRRWQERRSSE
jgi:plasmid stabilization system protein ParE